MSARKAFSEVYVNNGRRQKESRWVSRQVQRKRPVSFTIDARKWSTIRVGTKNSFICTTSSEGVKNDGTFTSLIWLTSFFQHCFVFSSSPVYGTADEKQLTYIDFLSSKHVRVSRSTFQYSSSVCSLSYLWYTRQYIQKGMSTAISIAFLSLHCSNTKNDPSIDESVALEICFYSVIEHSMPARTVFSVKHFFRNIGKQWILEVLSVGSAWKGCDEKFGWHFPSWKRKSLVFVDETVAFRRRAASCWFIAVTSVCRSSINLFSTSVDRVQAVSATDMQYDVQLNTYAFHDSAAAFAAPLNIFFSILQFKDTGRETGRFILRFPFLKRTC